VKLSVLSHAKEYHGAVAFAAIFTVAPYLWLTFAGNVECPLGVFAN
jgi:hypothetical protein